MPDVPGPPPVVATPHPHAGPLNGPTPSGPPAWWLATADDPLAFRPRLERDTEADVAIVGAGFTGLWTAWFLKRLAPYLEVVVLEREFAGFGASGRNGGWCSPGYPVSMGELQRRYGTTAMRGVYDEQMRAVDDMAAILAEEGIDADFHKGGALLIARAEHEDAALDRVVQRHRELDLPDRYLRLDDAATRARIDVADARGSLFAPQCATLHPGKLVRSLARRVEALGVRLFERSPVTDLGPRSAITPRARVRADTVVLATEAYTTRFRSQRRSLLPLYSLIVMTEPLSDDQWARIGWRQRECVTGMSLVLDYLTRTADGRLLFGGRGAPYFFGSSMRPAHERHRPTLRLLREALRAWFPMVRDEQIAESWGGPFAVARDWMPSILHDDAHGVAWARGYAGQGVVGSFVAARTLADLMIGRQTARTRLPAVGHRPPDWPYEPLRYLAVQYIRSTYFRQDANAASTGVGPSGRTFAERLARH